MARGSKLAYGQRGRVATAGEGAGWLRRLGEASRHLVKRRAMKAVRRLRNFFGRQSLVGDPIRFDPAVFPFLQAFEREWPAVRRELDALLETRARLPALAEISPDAARIGDERWKTFLLYGFGERSERNCATCPETARLLEGVPGLQNAWFSILAAGARVPRHKGISKGLIRCHIPLIVPDRPENCRMSLGKETFHWELGKPVVFDDTVKHGVWNATEQERVVLLFDFERPMRPLGRLLGRLFLAGVRRHGYYRDARRNQQAWEERYYGDRAQAA